MFLFYSVCTGLKNLESLDLVVLGQLFERIR